MCWYIIILDNYDMIVSFRFGDKGWVIKCGIVLVFIFKMFLDWEL